MSEIDETVAVPKKQYDEMLEKLASETQSKVNLVNEIKELREKKQLSESQVADLTKKLEQRAEVPGDSTGLTPEKIVELTKTTLQSALAEKEEAEAKQNQKEAMEAFLLANKEFHPDNDEGGIKLAALERELATFNMAGLKTKADFYDRLDKALKLVRTAQQSPTPGDDPNPPAPNGTQRGTPAPETTDDKLTPKEMKIIEQTFDGDKARYLKIKQKRPDYVATLLQYVI